MKHSVHFSRHFSWILDDLLICRFAVCRLGDAPPTAKCNSHPVIFLRRFLHKLDFSDATWIGDNGQWYRVHVTRLSLPHVQCCQLQPRYIITQLRHFILWLILFQQVQLCQRGRHLSLAKVAKELHLQIRYHTETFRPLLLPFTFRPPIFNLLTNDG